MILDTQQVSCPYCGEIIELALESLDTTQQYFEDCHVCCQPIFVTINPDGMSDNPDGPGTVICARADD